MTEIKKGDQVRILYTIEFPLDVPGPNGNFERKGVYTVRDGALGVVTRVYDALSDKKYYVKLPGVGRPVLVNKFEIELASALDVLNHGIEHEKATYRRSS